MSEATKYPPAKILSVVFAFSTDEGVGYFAGHGGCDRIERDTRAGECGRVPTVVVYMKDGRTFTMDAAAMVVEERPGAEDER